MILSGADSLVDYLTAHVLLCLVPAFFLRSAFNALIPSQTIFKYMGNSVNRTKKGIAYFFAATSGLIIEVCSCTVLPLFAGMVTLLGIYDLFYSVIFRAMRNILPCGRSHGRRQLPWAPYRAASYSTGTTYGCTGPS